MATACPRVPLMPLTPSVGRDPAGLGPFDAGADYSAQLPVRHSVLPSFEFDDRGDLRIVQPLAPGGDAVRVRWEERAQSPEE